MFHISQFNEPIRNDQECNTSTPPPYGMAAYIKNYCRMSTQTLKVIICIIYYAKFKQFSIGDNSFDYSSSVVFGWSEFYFYL